MSRYEGINTGRGASKVVSGIGKGPSHRTQEYSGTVDNHHSAREISVNWENAIFLLHGAVKAWLGHFKGKAHNELHERVEHNVLHINMNELVCEEAPDFVAPAGVVDEVGADGGLACQG